MRIDIPPDPAVLHAVETLRQLAREWTEQYSEACLANFSFWCPECGGALTIAEPFDDSTWIICPNCKGRTQPEEGWLRITLLPPHELASYSVEIDQDLLLETDEGLRLCRHVPVEGRMDKDNVKDWSAFMKKMLDHLERLRRQIS